MLTAKNKDSHKVIATLVEKSEGPFFCSECGSELRLRKGKVRIHHFAHIPPFSCAYGSGESQQHLECKIEIHEKLSHKPNIDKLELERSLDGLRPDISFRVNKQYYVGLEIQISTLDLREIERRTKRYRELGIYVCWILPMNDDIREERMSPKYYEKWIHLMNWGRVYYWTGGSRVLPVHFAEHLLEVAHSTWYSEGGEEQSAGGYTRKSKKFRKALIHDSIDLSDDFTAKERGVFSTSELSIPQSKIWHDKLKKWW